MSTEPTSIKVSFTFYPTDVQALNRCLVGLRRAGLPVRGGTVLRALIHLTSATEMFSILAMFSRDSVALACKIFNSSSIIHLVVRCAGR